MNEIERNAACQCENCSCEPCTCGQTGQLAVADCGCGTACDPTCGCGCGKDRKVAN